MEKQPKNILVVDDEEHILELLKFNLEKAGYQVYMAENGQEALKLLEMHQMDLMVLDLMLPDLDGIEICKRIRASEKYGMLPIIMLTAKSEEIDRILGLELGADDYMTKPFSVKELVVRIKTVLRRTEHQVGETTALIEWGQLVMDLARHEVTIQHQPVDLTLKEFELLRFLLQNRGRVMSRNFLLDEIWGYDYFGETRTVDVHIRNIRKKLGDFNMEDMIETVRGVGYKVR
ncbi:response regulator [Anoxynatronum buryatiense]|uniref:Stage 0 sporulation protein A homolog n=1 Tax=Anoxynatronum buryatiense TaxID=489973 RepID=A0AA45WWV2_9CLOT|nr:response regulator transcription factor [Anoxynatronum buryatiense]SMP61279.1 two-component system, OmpR family, alkaline phosphatase synthesis response regulator PhoP [Anoxynatronum buryatiense]